MVKTKKQLYAELEVLKNELPRREAIAALLETDGFKLAVEEYKSRFKSAIDDEDKKEISACKKTLDLIIDFQGFLTKQKQRAEKLPEIIADIEFDLQQGNLFE